jgi:hypothetical protein
MGENFEDVYGNFDQPRKYVMGEPMKASEARMRAKNSSKIIAEKELAEIYDKIIEQCNQGSFELVIDGTLSVHAKNRLNELGYNHCEVFEPTGKKTKISWLVDMEEK